MKPRPFVAAAIFFAALTALFLPNRTVQADSDSDKKPAKTQGTASGLMTDFKDSFMLVQLDGEDETTKFLYGTGMTLKGLTDHHIFPVDRVNIKWKLDGDDKKIVGIEKVEGKKQGIVIGKVIKVYNNFWVAVKPNDGGMIEGFALNGPADKVKNVLDVLKSLNPGDQVAIKYATDFERHRILQMESKPAPAK